MKVTDRAERFSLIKATLVAAALVAVGSCANAGSSQIDGPVVAISGQDTGDSNASGVEGEMSLVDGCLMLGEFVLVWPEGTSWDDRPRAVVRADGTRIDIGGQVLATGDPLDDLNATLGEDGADIIKACGGAGANDDESSPDGWRAVIVAI